MNQAMTLPGLVQLILTVGLSVAAFVAYLREPRQILAWLGIAAVLSVAGIANILWGNTQSIGEILLFQAKDFYIGTASLTGGIGLFVGASGAWATLALNRLMKRT